MKLSVGLSDFRDLINENYTFVDKTLFIKDIMEDGARVILITRPRRFGKTLNLSMLGYFLKCHDLQNENIFKGLNISKHEEFCKKHQNQYPVISITLKNTKHSNYTDAYADVVSLISKLYTAHQYLLDDTTLHEHEKNIFIALLNKTAGITEISEAIRNLSEYLHRKFNKSPVLLIDEYDTPIQAAYMHGYYDEMTQLMCSILGMALKDNSYLSKAVLTGITRIAQESLFSGLNNLEVYSLLREEYGQYFGFTEDEVVGLIAQTGNKDIKLEPIKEWYNGYQIGQYTLYNPWSILNCLKNKGKLAPYWLNTATNDLLNKLFINSEPFVKQQIEELIQGKVIERPLSENLIFPDIERQESALWSLLLYAGYLKVLSFQLKNDEFVGEITIPNKEVGLAYSDIVKKWFTDKMSLESYNALSRSLREGNTERFKTCISSYIIQAGSYFDFTKNTPERVFHIFILGLVLGLRDDYDITSNRESGQGRADVIFIPKNRNHHGVLIEFKTAKSNKLLLSRAKEALEQIKNKEYITTFKQNDVKSILAIGMSFCGKEMELVSEMLG